MRIKQTLKVIFNGTSSPPAPSAAAATPSHLYKNAYLFFLSRLPFRQGRVKTTNNIMIDSIEISTYRRSRLEAKREMRKLQLTLVLAAFVVLVIFWGQVTVRAAELGLI